MLDRQIKSTVVQKRWQPVIDAISNSSETAYLLLLGLHISATLLQKIRWNHTWEQGVQILRTGIISIVLWGSALYLFEIITRIKIRNHKRAVYLLTCIALVGGVIVVSRNMTESTYSMILDAFFCFTAIGKKFYKILFLYLILGATTLLTGLVGYRIGIASDFLVFKPDRVNALHSIGLSHPNTWAHIILMLILIIWYLLLQNHVLVTGFLFWGFAWFIITIFSCKTVAFLMILFPFVVIITEYYQKKGEEPAIIEQHRITWLKSGLLKRIISICAIFLPVILFTVSIILCWQMDWVQKTFYETRFMSLAMRFVEGGYALRHNDISLFGQAYHIVYDSSVPYIGSISHVLDNAFVYYVIWRGILWVIACLSWLVFTNVRCCKNRDYRFLLIAECMLLMAVMEHFGLDVWFNFTLLYPLASHQITGKIYD